MMVSHRIIRARRRRLLGIVAVSLVLGGVVSALLAPQYFSNAGTNGVSTIYKTARNTVDGSIAASAGAPGGAKTGTAKPGDTLTWVVDYRNETSAVASVNLTDPLSAAGAYVPGSLQLPASQIPDQPFDAQFTTDGGASWQKGNPPANANGVGFTGGSAPSGNGTQGQFGEAFQKPVGFAFNQTGGDAYNGVVAQVNGHYQVYASYHHNTSQSNLLCVTTTGQACPGWPSTYTYASTQAGLKIGTGPYSTMATTWQNGTFIVGTTLFWEAQSTVKDATGKYPVGMMCLDIVTLVSCGFHPLDYVTFAPYFAGTNPLISGTGIPAADGRYYFATANGKFLCFDPSAFIRGDTTSTGLCGSIDVGGVTGSDRPPHTATYGDYVFAAIVPMSTSANPNIYCYRVATKSLCPGFPQAFSNGVPGGSAAHGALAPMLSVSGAVTGVCSLTSGIEGSCWTTAGTRVASPYPTVAGFNDAWAGDGLWLGTKAYVPVNADNSVGCFDFSRVSGGHVQPCSGFTPSPNKYNYTSRTIDGVPGCLIATGDGRVMNTFDAETGGPCLTTFASVTVDPRVSYCGSGAAGFHGWRSVDVVDTPASSYTDAIVTIYDINRQAVQGFDGVTLKAGVTSLDISSIPSSGPTSRLSVEVTLRGVVDQNIADTRGTVALRWDGDPVQMCYQTVAPPAACDVPASMLTNVANAVTTSPTGVDGPGGNSSGAAGFALTAASSQCSLVYEKTSPVQAAGPGDSVDFAITVQNTGTQAYVRASFTDDLTDVLKDAAYNNDHSSSVGAVAYTAPVLTWSGALAPGAMATITYSVRVKSPDPGDHSMVNRVTSTTPGGNCAPGSRDPVCAVTVRIDVKDVTWHKVDGTAAKNVLEGSEWTFTAVDGSGRPTGAPIVITDCVAAVAPDCTSADIDPLAGIFRLTNLGAGTYELVETKAPAGFVLNSKPIPVTIRTDSTTVSLPDVVNKQLTVPPLPLTGGVGADTFTIAGGALVAVVAVLACWGLLRRRRSA